MTIFSVCVGVISIAISILIYAIGGLFFRHFLLKGFRLTRLESLKFSLSQCNWLTQKFPVNSQDFNGFKAIKNTVISALFFELDNFEFGFNNFRLEINIKAFHLYLSSNIFLSRKKKKPTAKRSSNKYFKMISNLVRVLIRFFFRYFSLKCDKCCIIISVGDINDVDSVVFESIWLKNIVIATDEMTIFTSETMQLEQIHISEMYCNNQTIIRADSLNCKQSDSFSYFEVSLDNSLSLNIEVAFLFFIASFIKIIIASESDEEYNPQNTNLHPSTSTASFLPWSISLRIKIPNIKFKLILPETEEDSRFFSNLQVNFENFDALCFLLPERLPKITFWSDLIRIIAVIDSENIGRKYFCPVDEMLGRGRTSAMGKSKELMSFEKITFCNWVPKNSNLTNIPPSSIQDMFASILNGSSICRSTHVLDIIDENDPQKFLKDNISNKTSAFSFLKPSFFESLHDIQRLFFSHFEKFEFYIPFEFPISSLIDHSVVLFKAGWRPLSKKTERGYWIGDGDKFLRNDWTISITSAQARMRIGDDKFEVKLSYIGHCQRIIAESRNRSEMALIQRQFSEPDTSKLPTSNFEASRSLANHLITSSDFVENRHVLPLIELHKSLFREYKSLINQSKALTDWSLLEFSIDDLKINSSWSPSYIGSHQLHQLLNRIENGSELTNNSITDLATFVGGFFDLKGSSIQLNLRNYPRPVFLAPDLHIVGPLYLVEAGVKDPDVLVKFSVKIVPASLKSNFECLPECGSVDVLRSILPLKLYHCVNIHISEPQLVQITVSPYWLGCLALLDRVLDRFVKSSTEDPSPPLPGWDKLRYNVRGCHSYLSIQSPCLISRIADSDPFFCDEMLNLSFPFGLNVGLVPDGIIQLNCPEVSLCLVSKHSFKLNAAHFASKPIRDWDFNMSKDRKSSLMNGIPTIRLTNTKLQLIFDVRNLFNELPVHHWSVSPTTRSTLDCV